MEEHRLIKNIVFRLVRRHIAGSTMNSALNAVRYLNGKGMNTTLTFLNEHVSDPIKARYNTNTYVQMIRQISRLHLNSSVSVRLSQIGYATGHESADRFLDEILEAASEGTTVWLESGAGVTNDQLMSVYHDRKGMRNLGVEIPISYYGKMDGLTKMIKPNGMVRITSHEYMAERKPENEKTEERSMLARYLGAIGVLVKKSGKVFIHESNDRLIAKIAKSSNGHKQNLTFGIPFGYSAHKLNKLEKLKLNLDVYVPFGKDWTTYAIYGLAGNRTRSIATALLNGQKIGEYNAGE